MTFTLVLIKLFQSSLRGTHARTHVHTHTTKWTPIPIYNMITTPVQTSRPALEPIVSFSMLTAVLSLGKGGRGVKLTTLLHLVPRLRMSTVIPLPPLCLSLFLSKMVQAVFAGFSPRRPVFSSRTVRVSIVVDKVTPVQVYPRVLRVSPATDTPPMLDTHSSMTDHM
jgi:hypothetical protein